MSLESDDLLEARKMTAANLTALSNLMADTRNLSGQDVANLARAARDLSQAYLNIREGQR